MSWTKRQFIEMAFEELGIASYTYDLKPEMLDHALRRLDAMMAGWNAKGIRVGYPIPSSPENSDLDEETNVNDTANEAVYTNLALSMAPANGKTVSPETKINAKRAYQNILSFASVIIQRQFPTTLPKGQGNKPWRFNRDEYVDKLEQPLDAGKDSAIDFD